LPEKEEESVSVPDAGTPDASEPATPTPLPEPTITPIPEPTPLPASTTNVMVPIIENKQVDVYCGKGRKKLRGKPGITNFIFDKSEKFIRKNADHIIKFNRKEDDSIHLDQELYGLSDDWRFAKTRSKRRLNRLAKSDVDLIYFQKKGFLYLNGNGEDRGFGNRTEGGLLAILKGQPSLGAADIQLI
jgi:hypothetical protein